MQKWGKGTTIFNIASVFFYLQFNFLLQAVPDIISAYWIFGNVNQVATKKRKLDYRANLPYIRYM